MAAGAEEGAVVSIGAGLAGWLVCSGEAKASMDGLVRAALVSFDYALPFISWSEQKGQQENGNLTATGAATATHHDCS